MEETIKETQTEFRRVRKRCTRSNIYPSTNIGGDKTRKDSIFVFHRFGKGDSIKKIINIKRENYKTIVWNALKVCIKNQKIALYLETKDWIRLVPKMGLGKNASKVLFFSL